MRWLAFVVCCLPVSAADVALRAALHARIQNGATVIPYASAARFDVSDALRSLDRDPDRPGQVRVVYSVATSRSEDYGEVTGWNIEHLWPSSYGIERGQPPYSDLHHLRACDATVNSSRGNKWFDWSSAAEGGIRRPAHREAPIATADVNSWEPPPGERGDIARALFYMDVRYEGDAPDEPDLVLVEDVSRISSGAAFMGRLSALLHWNLEDPPDDAERRRDAEVAALQGNVNPFVADPELAVRIFMPAVQVKNGGGLLQFVTDATDLPVVLEFSESVTGPWSTVAPRSGAQCFARARLKE